MARFGVINAALGAEEVQLAANELSNWLRYVPIDRVEDDNDERANVRQVVSSILDFADNPHGRSHEECESLLDRCGELIKQAHSVIPNDLIERYSALRQQ